MKVFWRQVKHELSHARDADLILAVIASFAAWIITLLLWAVFWLVTGSQLRALPGAAARARADRLQYRSRGG